MARRLEPGEELCASEGNLSTLGRPCSEARKATLWHVNARREAKLHDHPGQAIALNRITDQLRDESTLRRIRARGQRCHSRPEDERPHREESQP